VHGQRAWRGVKPHEIEIMFVSRKEEHTVILFVAISQQYFFSYQINTNQQLAVNQQYFFSQQINVSHELQHSEHSG